MLERGRQLAVPGRTGRLNNPNMLALFEPVCHGLEHVGYNAGMVASALQIDTDRVVFLAEAEHLGHVRDFVPSEVSRAVTWQPIQVAPRRLSRFRERLALESHAIRQLWSYCPRDQATGYLFTGVSEAGLLALKIALWRHKSPRTLVILHSITRYIAASRMRQLVFSAGTPASLHYGFLSDSIRKDAESLIPALRNRSHYIPHPWVHITPGADRVLTNDQVTIAFVGRGTTDKNFKVFLELIRACLDDPACATAKFVQIGKYDDGFEPDVRLLRERGAGRFVCAEDPTQKLSSDAYAENLRNADYALMPYSPGEYRFIFGGAFMDALAAAKPVIAFDAPFIQEIFQRMGDIGYICKDQEEVIRLVRGILADPPVERYARQRSNLLKGRSVYSEAEVAKTLRSGLGI